MSWGNKALFLPPGFRNIPGFTRYGISENGNVYSLINAKLKTTWIDTRGYLCVGLQCDKDKKTKIRRVHVVLMAAWVGPRKKGMVCCHNDGNRKNNSLKNLRYDTPAGNTADMAKHGTKRTGHAINTSKLKPEDIIYIKKHYKAKARKWSNAPELAKKFNVSTNTIVSAFAGRTYK